MLLKNNWFNIKSEKKKKIVKSYWCDIKSAMF